MPRVALDITEQVPTRTQVGTAYDFVTKTTSPVYRYGQRTTSLGSRTATTARGRHLPRLRWRSRAATAATGHRLPHGRGRPRRSPPSGYGFDVPLASDSGTWSSSRSGGRPTPSRPSTSATGSRVEARGGHPEPATDRYLFTVTHLGLRSATVQPGPAFGGHVPQLVGAGCLDRRRPVQRHDLRVDGSLRGAVRHDATEPCTCR